MKKKSLIFSLSFFVSTTLFLSCSPAENTILNSPNGKLRFELMMHETTHRPVYTIHFENQEIIGSSGLGFELANNEIVPSGVSIGSINNREVNQEWEPVYGEKSRYSDRYHEAIIELIAEDDTHPMLHLQVRAYNEGIAFRYLFNTSENTVIKRELTAFALPDGSEAWVSTRAQGPITKLKVEAIDQSVERPLLAQISDSVFVAIGEAGLVDFARMKFIQHETDPGTLVADLASEVMQEGEFATPWRFIMAGHSAGEILEHNYLLLNLNPPNQIADTDWIKPGKVIREVTLTTQGGMACVDFAEKHNLQYIEFDAGWYGHEYDTTSDATTVTVDPKRSKGPLELPKVIDYATQKGIGVLLYVNRRALERQLDEVLPVLQSWGIKGVKYGFVNVGSQQWTTWLHDAVQKAANHQLMVDIHDEYRPTGFSRTYPNLMTQEGIRGDEESPDNAMVLNTLFTRMIAGAGDHTNCYFAPRVDEKMGSHASQLAKSVCIYSPWQFLYWYDRPEGSPVKVGGAGNNELFIREVPELAFFDQLPTVWDETKVLDGYPGSHAVIARRSGSTWFVGALNGKVERDFAIPLAFLDANQSYNATLYSDDPNSTTPTKVGTESQSLTSSDVIHKQLGSNQGLAIIIRQ